MTKRTRRISSFRGQMEQSIGEIQSIMYRRQSPLGGGRFTVRTIEVAEPSRHTAASVRAIRKSLNISQALFAQLVGVSPALVRAWELGTRVPAPIARRLLDQIRENRSSFTSLVRVLDPVRRPMTSTRARRVA
jgi:DNA-binding transcriptional regulator YiaG